MQIQNHNNDPKLAPTQSHLDFIDYPLYVYVALGNSIQFDMQIQNYSNGPNLASTQSNLDFIDCPFYFYVALGNSI